MNRGISLLLAYLGLAWLLAGGGALLPAFEARSDANEGQDFAVELVVERATPLVEAVKAQIKELEAEKEPPAEQIAALREEAAAILAQADTEIAAIKAASSTESSGIMSMLGPMLALIGGMALLVLGLITLKGGSDVQEVPRKRRKRKKSEAGAEVPPGV